MRQLRPHLTDEAEFLARAKGQMANENWRLIYVEDSSDGGCGLRLSHPALSASGKTLYVDDLGDGRGQALQRPSAKS